MYDKSDIMKHIFGNTRSYNALRRITMNLCRDFFSDMMGAVDSKKQIHINIESISFRKRESFIPESVIMNGNTCIIESGDMILEIDSVDRAIFYDDDFDEEWVIQNEGICIYICVN